MPNLREVIERGTLDEFIEEHGGVEKGDKARFDATLKSLVGKSKEGQEASPRDFRDD